MGLFRATRYVASLPLVDVDELVSSGVRLVLLDRDNTCVPRDAASAPAEVLAWLDRAREAGLGLCLVSNNFHSSQVGRTARELGVEVVDHAMKPAPFALARAMRLMGKRQIGEMQPFELVITLLIAEVAAVPMQSNEIPMAYGLISIAVLVSLEVILSTVSLKFPALNELISGRPSIVIAKFEPAGNETVSASPLSATARELNRSDPREGCAAVTRRTTSSHLRCSSPPAYP